MCGRFTTAEDRQQVFNQTGLMPPPEWVPRYNVAPHQRVLAVRHDRHGARELAMLSWGLLPAWSRDASVAHRSINARAETLPLKAAFKDAFRARRCLILADGFYEWLPVTHATKKRPVYFRFREPMMLAGLWERWQRPGVPAFESCAVVTVPANDVIARISERMPAILDTAAQRAWLGPDSTAEHLRACLAPLDPRRLEPVNVSEDVNHSSNDYAALLAPVAA